MDAKMRVMPTCWFLLSKLFVRVDQKLVRSRETRLFHAFKESYSPGEPIEIQMEVVWRELSFSYNVDVGKSPAGANAMKNYTKDMTNSLPGVNESEGVHQYFTLVNTCQ